MGTDHIYHNFIWKSIYGNINSKRIFSRFKKGEQFRNGFNWITHNSAGLLIILSKIPNRTYLSIKDIGVEFEFINNWITSKNYSLMRQA